MSIRNIRGVTAICAAAVLALAGCAADTADDEAGADTSTITVEDNHGEQSVTVPPQSVVATDNSTFETLDTWGVELSAASVALMPDTISYKQQDGLVDLGNHREPNLEAIVAADPDLIINGGRFGQFREDFQGLVPDAAIVEVDPREGEPLVDELKHGTTVLGEIFDKATEAEGLNADLDAAVERVKAAYDPQMSVIGLISTSGELGYVAPSTGRTIGPLFDVFGFTPALDVEGSTFDQGDDISVEAIANANPDLIIVMDRDAPLDSAADDWVPAADVVSGSAALQGVSAVQDDNVIYLPADTYLNESIQTYTEFFNSLADLLEGNS